MPDYALIWAAVSSRPQDKYSIEDQLKLARDWCHRQGVAVVDELVVRGFSRDYWTLADVVAAASADKDMTAFARLQDHIQRRTFTVFVCFDADRFGRTASLVHEVIGRITRDCGARIYTLFDGMTLDAANATMVGTMKAFKAQTDIERLREYRKTGAENRARDGKVSQGRPPLFQRVIRDASGNEIAVTVNEDLRGLWSDLAVLLLRGVPWNSIEQNLFEEFGHAAAPGRPYRTYYMYRLVTHPAWWGHSVLHLRLKEGRSIQRVGAWAWDESVPPPAGTTIYYNRFPAVYGGDYAALGELVKAELWRRLNLRGRAHPLRTHRFSGLVVCGGCGCLMHHTQSRWSAYLRCDTAIARTRTTRTAVCDQKRYLRADDVQAWIDAQLRAALAHADDAQLFTELQHSDTLTGQLSSEEKRAAKLRSRAEQLIVDLADAPDNLKAMYRQKLNETASQLDHVTEQIGALRVKLSTMRDASSAQTELLDRIRADGVDWFWSQPDVWIHQQLAAALGVNRLVCRDGEVIGVIPMPRKSAWRFS